MNLTVKDVLSIIGLLAGLVFLIIGVMENSSIASFIGAFLFILCLDWRYEKRY